MKSNGVLLVKGGMSQVKSGSERTGTPVDPLYPAMLGAVHVLKYAEAKKKVQTVRQEATDAVDAAGRPSFATDADQGPQQRARGDVPPMVPAVPVRCQIKCDWP